MKTLIFNGSPRKNGDTMILVNEFIKNLDGEYKIINEYKNNNIYDWAIELKGIGEVIGGISIVKLDEKNYSCEMGYCMSRKYWSKGIMSESLRVVINYLFSEVEFNRIVAKRDTNNIASGKVMVKSGMKYEGTLREVKLRNNKEFYDLAVYGIIKKDWVSNNE